MNCKPHFSFVRVSREVRCPICNHDGWCMVSPFGDRAVCCRVESDWHAPAFQGWFHEIPVLERLNPSHIARHARPAVLHEVQDFSTQHAEHVDRFSPLMKERAAAVLGLQPHAFDAYPVGYNHMTDALAIPAMQIGSPRFIGIRYRALGRHQPGMKWLCAAGSTAGLLLPHAPPHAGRRVYLLEGPSDTFAAAQVGLHALGRWSCGLNARQLDTLRAHVAGCDISGVVVVGDNDKRSTGQRGADSAAELVAVSLPGIKVLRLQPPAGTKDLREWVVGGGTAAEIECAAREVQNAG